jgi:hypothetical protein
MNERDRQYYDFAKENLITFGSMDEPTESTGHSREELLQRRRTEETREKRKEKKRNNKSRNRIINFPTGLLKSSSSQQQNYVSPQNQPQNQPSSSNYRNLAKLTSLEGDGRGENVFDDSGDRPNPDNNGGGLRGIRGSMVRAFVCEHFVANVLLQTFCCKRFVANILLNKPNYIQCGRLFLF